MARRNGRSVTATIRDALEQADRERRAEVSARAEQTLMELRAMKPRPRDLLAPGWRDKSSVEICKSIYAEDGDFAP